MRRRVILATVIANASTTAWAPLLRTAKLAGDAAMNAALVAPYSATLPMIVLFRRERRATGGLTISFRREALADVSFASPSSASVIPGMTAPKL